MAFWKFIGTTAQVFPAQRITAQPGEVYSFGSEGPPPAPQVNSPSAPLPVSSTLWVSDNGPATASSESEELLYLQGLYSKRSRPFEGMKLITHGTSYVGEQASVCSPGSYYPRKVANRLGMSYPTSIAGSNLKFGLNGSRAEDMAQIAIGAVVPSAGGVGTWVNGATSTVVLIDALINSARLHGNDATALLAATNAMRAAVATISAPSRKEQTDATVFTTFSGTWTQGNSNTALSAGSSAFTTAQNAYVDVVAPSNSFYFLTMGRNTASAAVFTATDQTAGGTLLATVDTSNQATAAPDTPTFVNLAVKINTTAGHTIRFKKTDAGAGSFHVDAVLPISGTPPLIVLVKSPYLADYSLSGTFPNGSDAAIDAFNAICDTLATEFSNVVVANPNSGYWNKATCIYSGDGVHPNDIGTEALAKCVADALKTYYDAHGLPAGSAVL